jgi:hypothetical protein
MPKIFDHNRFRPDPKPLPKVKVKCDLKKAVKKKVTGEADLFREIWMKRPHVSEISGEPLGDEMCSWMFMHVLSKAQNKYPLFKLLPRNIILGTWEEHHIWDKAPRSEIINDPKWKSMLDLEKQLKEEYKLLTPKK